MSLIHTSYFKKKTTNYNLLCFQTPMFRLPHIKQYFILQVPLPIDFLVILWPLSHGWDSGNSDSFYRIV